jgi:hypothetical protein
LEEVQYQVVSQLFGYWHSTAQHAGSATTTPSSSDTSSSDASSSSSDDIAADIDIAADTGDSSVDSSSSSSSSSTGRLPVKALKQLLSEKKLPLVECSFKVSMRLHVAELMC